MFTRFITPLVVLFTIACAYPRTAEAGTQISLENRRMKLVFDETRNNWALRSLRDKTDGFDFLAPGQSGAPLWEIEFIKRGAPRKIVFRGGSSGEPADIFFADEDRVVIDAGSGAKRVSHSFIDGDKRRLQLVWEGIGLPDGSEVNVKADIDLSQEDGLSRWTLSLDNDSSTYSLWMTRFVRLEGLAHAKRPDSEFYVQPAGSGLRYPMLVEGRAEWVYPSSCMELQLMSYLLTDSGKGLFLACYDSDANTKKMHLSDKSGVRTFYWEHYPENMGQIGGSYTLPYPVVIAPFDGDWFEAAQIYKQWATQQPWCSRGILAHNDTPDWLKKTHVWKRPDGEPAEMRKNMLAFSEWFQRPFAVQWYCWNQRTYDTLYPDFFPAQPGFKEAVAEMEPHDIHIFPYINGLLCDPKSETWSEGAEQWVSKTADGRKYPYPIESDFWAYHMCPATQFWQDRLRRLASDMNDAAETSGLYFDCLGGMDTKLCFDESHGHPLGGGHYWYRGFQLMMDGIRDDFKKKNRDVAFTTELMSEVMIGQFDGVLWTTIDSTVSIPLFQAIYGQHILSFGRGLRWEDWEQDGCFENREAEALTWGYQFGWQVGTRGGSGNFELEPQYKERSEFFKVLADAREAGRDYLVFGQMMKPLVLQGVPTVQLDGSYKVFGGQSATKPVLYGSAWKNERGEIALCFVNASREAVSTTFNLPAEAYGFVAEKKLEASVVYPSGATAADVQVSAGRETSKVTVPARQALIVKLTQR